MKNSLLAALVAMIIVGVGAFAYKAGNNITNVTNNNYSQTASALNAIPGNKQEGVSEDYVKDYIVKNWNNPDNNIGWEGFMITRTNGKRMGDDFRKNKPPHFINQKIGPENIDIKGDVRDGKDEVFNFHIKLTLEEPETFYSETAEKGSAVDVKGFVWFHNDSTKGWEMTERK